MIRRNQRRRRRRPPAAAAAIAGGAAAAAAGAANAPARDWSIGLAFTGAAPNATFVTFSRNVVFATVPQNWRLHKGGIGGQVRTPIFHNPDGTGLTTPTAGIVYWDGDGAQTAGSVVTVGQQDPGFRGTRGGFVEAGTYFL